MGNHAFCIVSAFLDFFEASSLSLLLTSSALGQYSSLLEDDSDHHVLSGCRDVVPVETGGGSSGGSLVGGGTGDS